MANDKMMAQMSSKDGFIAALDQSGGSTPALCASMAYRTATIAATPRCSG
jgi:fructose-bisphosphate aldolase class 1